VKIGVIFDVGIVVSPDVVDDLVAQSKNSLFMRYLILMVWTVRCESVVLVAWDISPVVLS
jgi:hypothetical protein